MTKRARAARSAIVASVVVVGAVLASAAAAMFLPARFQVSMPPRASKEAPPAPEAPPPGQSTERLEVPPPPFTEGIFPCSNCHVELPVNRARRELTDMHGDIVLTHDEQHRWCLDCHDAVDRDALHLASGEKVSFDESYRLCGQCHGEKLRDWTVGVHGRRTGDWNGHKKYLLCANCHNPHQPRFKSLAPMPAPTPPSRPTR